MRKNEELSLVCPCAQKSGLKSASGRFLCSCPQCEHADLEMAFGTLDGTPVLISETRCDTVCRVANVQSYVARADEKTVGLRALLLGEGAVTQKNVARFLEEVKHSGPRPKILVIGSGTRGKGSDQMWLDEGVLVHGTDIYNSESVDVVCDAHYLPFPSESYEGVYVQAVLEHVVEPLKVVGEIARILKPSGVVYAETPFMQHVHEGAYDFTRYTVLGHRYLFKEFEEVASGGNGGPEVVFSWSIRYLVWAVTRSKRLGKLFGVAVSLLSRPLGALASRPSMHDASSGVYFLGRKVAGHTLTHKQLIGLYKGQFRHR